MIHLPFNESAADQEPSVNEFRPVFTKYDTVRTIVRVYSEVSLIGLFPANSVGL